VEYLVMWFGIECMADAGVNSGEN